MDRFITWCFRCIRVHWNLLRKDWILRFFVFLLVSWAGLTVLVILTGVQWSKTLLSRWLLFFWVALLDSKCLVPRVSVAVLLFIRARCAQDNLLVCIEGLAGLALARLTVKRRVLIYISRWRGHLAIRTATNIKHLRLLHHNQVLILYQNLIFAFRFFPPWQLTITELTDWLAHLTRLILSTINLVSTLFRLESSLACESALSFIVVLVWVDFRLWVYFILLICFKLTRGLQV